uniref:Homologous recombination OB-fold protein OB-fold domain-containing protein n=1 Tax=Tanacetum cinerariifolium TaxID=118510 RepID=A0A6L2KUJ7_TANCI|nr:hypothetical protein [Tanacetum cinerariifolium]
MACLLSHTDSEVEALVQKLIDEDKGRQNAILDLALQFENACTAKDDLRNVYEKCNDISQESRDLIDSFLKEGSDKDYELNLSMYENAAKLEKQIDAKLDWLLEKYYHRSQESVGCSSSQADLYLTKKELHQLHLDEEALRETLEEKAMDEKTLEEKIRQKQADDDEFFMEFGMVRYDSEYESLDYLDIDDSDLHLTPVMRSSSSARVEPSPYTLNPVTIIPGPASSQATLRKGFIHDSDGALMLTQEYMQKVIEDVGEDDDFNSGAWFSVTNYVIATGGTITGCLGDINNFLRKEKLKQVVAIVKSCSPNVLGDLNVTMKDLSGTIPETIHHKVIGEEGYGKDITVGAAMILVNVSVFTTKSSDHYLNITKRNVVKVFRKDTVSLVLHYYVMFL